MKFCETCMILRPKSCSHCNICNNCVHGFDHHCIWLGTCVGIRNYPEFLAFIVSIILLSSHVIITSCIRLYMKASYYENDLDDSTSPKHAFGTWGIGSILLILYSTAALLFVSFLLNFHCRLIKLGEELSSDQRLWPPLTEGMFDSATAARVHEEPLVK